jgi:hypothetical protein
MNIATLNVWPEARAVDKFAVQNTNLTNVNLANITRVRDFAFSGSPNISNFTGGAGIRNVGENAFTHTSWYENTCAAANEFVTIGKTILTYAGNKSTITESDFPAGVVTIAPYAFQFNDGENPNHYSNSIESIFIPKRIESIGKSAFAGNENLVSVKFDPKSKIQKIEDFVFSCTGITKLMVPDWVDSLGLGFVSGCPNLTEMTFYGFNAPTTYDDNLLNTTVQNINIPKWSVAAYTARLTAAGYTGRISYISTRVSFDSNLFNASGTIMTDVRIYYYGEPAYNLPPVPQSAYIFYGWQTQDGYQVEDGYIWNIFDETYTLIARYAPWDWMLPTKP